MTATPLIQAAILGTVQGVTEFLPVSSTAHLAILQRLFRLDTETYGLSFDLFTNIGTLVAVLVVLRADVVNLFRRFHLPTRAHPLTSEEKLPWLILIGTVPALLAGYFLESFVDSDARSFPIITVGLVAVALLMLLAEQQLRRQTSRSKTSETAILPMGVAQAVALFPGVSRSGITMSTGIFCGLSRTEAARASFLLSIPITAAAITKRMLTFTGDAAANGIAGDTLAFYLIGLLFATVTGYLAVRFLLRALGRTTLTGFAYYRLILAGVLIILS